MSLQRWPLGFDDSPSYAAPLTPWASFPPASTVEGQIRRPEELPHVSLIALGGRWRPLGGRQAISHLQAPIILGSGGTVGANGALTYTTALDMVRSHWNYFAANAVYAGSAAGFYWVVPSSGTNGVIYDNIYVPSSRNWAPPASPTPIVAAGPGAFTGITAEVTALNIAIPANLLGPYGALESFQRLSTNNTPGAKLIRHFLGGTQIAAKQINSTVYGLGGRVSVSNQGVTNRQHAVWDWDTGLGSGNLPIPSIDTTAATSFTVTLQHSGSANDVVWLTGNYVELVG